MRVIVYSLTQRTVPRLKMSTLAVHLCPVSSSGAMYANVLHSETLLNQVTHSPNHQLSIYDQG